MSTQKKTAASRNATVSKSTVSHSMMAQPQRLSQLVTADDIAAGDAARWVEADLAAELAEHADSLAREDFLEAARLIAAEADSADLALLARAIRETCTSAGDRLKLPGFLLAGIAARVFGLGDFGTGRREATRREIAASAARRRLTAAGVEFVDDLDDIGVAQKC
jgi:hypothetical protein